MEKTPVRIVESFHNTHYKGLQQGEQREESPLRPAKQWGKFAVGDEKGCKVWENWKGAANVESDPLESSLIEAGKKWISFLFIC